MLKITTLSENTADNLGLLAEWGLSILIETGDANILLDTGQTMSVTHNAKALGIDLKIVDKIVLSHGAPGCCRRKIRRQTGRQTPKRGDAFSSPRTGKAGGAF
jgi:hypothetical protein